MRDVVGYHFGWCDELGRPGGGRSGKLIRPGLTLLAAQAVGAERDRAVDAAVAVELVHNFVLLHDDVMDGALTRRARQTVWWQFGMPAAILAGDALLPLAIEVVAATTAGRRAAPDAAEPEWSKDTGGVQTPCEAGPELGHGQGADISLAQRGD